MRKLKRIYAVLKSSIESERESDLLTIGFYSGGVTAIVIFAIFYIVDKILI